MVLCSHFRGIVIHDRNKKSPRGTLSIVGDDFFWSCRKIAQISHPFSHSLNFIIQKKTTRENITKRVAQILYGYDRYDIKVHLLNVENLDKRFLKYES